MPNYPGWGFHSFNPWRPRFDFVIQMCLQAGLIDHWKDVTWRRMKRTSLEMGQKPILIVEREAISKLNLDDLQVTIAIILVRQEGLYYQKNLIDILICFQKL